jgi:hypothetical protein
MNANRFDTITKRLAEHRFSRRTALGGGGTALATAALGAFTRQTSAQPATPAAATPPPGTDLIHPGAGWVKPTALFTQTFEAGTWRPKPGEPNAYTLTLEGVSAETVGFTDRPERLAGVAPTQAFLNKLGFTPANPPNAALVAAPTGGGAQDVLVIELRHPVYDAQARTLTYDAAVVPNYTGTGLAALAQHQRDFAFAGRFGAGGLFIDDCGDGTATCYNILNGQNNTIGNISNVGCCADPVLCDLCNSDGTSWYYGMLCHEDFPDQCAYYSNGLQGWDCYAENLSCASNINGE